VLDVVEHVSGLNKRAPGTWSRAESRIERKIEAVPLVELANLGNV
jgi:hypothetical protein